MYRVKKGFILLISLLFFVLFLPKQVLAFTSASDTISTSRPSASTIVTAQNAVGDNLLQTLDNKSIFLASDSAIIWPQAGHTGGGIENIYVASQSADRTKVWFNTNLANIHQIGYTLVTTAVTAKHTITFTLGSTALVGEKINIVFPQPAAGDTVASSPSAQAFMFNGLATGANLTMTPSAGGTCTVSIPNNYTIQCTVTGSNISAGASITTVVGVNSPVLINPAEGGPIGTADVWRLTLQHLASDGVTPTVEKDYRLAIATIENVQVTAMIDATITWTIQGIPDATNIKTDGTWGNAGCTSNFSFATNAGAGSTAIPNAVILGYLTNNPSIAAQKFTISTNASGGYALTATSSGMLRSIANGWSIANAQGTNLTADNTPVPALMPAAGDFDSFGISACGTNANSAFDGPKYGNPATNTPGTPYVYKLAGYTGSIGGDIVSVLYGAKAKSTTPAGVYQTVLSYVVTATF